VRLSLSQITTASASLAEDVAAYRAAGFDAIGIWEFKLTGDDEADLETIRAAGLEVANCVPAVPSILPNAVVEGPTDVDERIEALCASVRRLARFSPASVLCLTGAQGRLGEAEARRAVIEGLKRVAAAAGEAGVRFGLEPAHVSQREVLTLVSSIPEALDLLEEAGLPEVGIMFDTFHLWDTPTVFADIEAEIDRITGVHVADWPSDPDRTDRELPGRGMAPVGELIAALEQAGWRGFYDVEIFADPLGFGALPAEAAAREAYAAMRALDPAAAG
jgi:sugar phosphate isomerase/epimerase